MIDWNHNCFWWSRVVYISLCTVSRTEANVYRNVFPWGMPHHSHIVINVHWPEEKTCEHQSNKLRGVFRLKRHILVLDILTSNLARIVRKYHCCIVCQRTGAHLHVFGCLESLQREDVRRLTKKNRNHAIGCQISSPSNLQKKTQKARWVKKPFAKYPKHPSRTPG